MNLADQAFCDAMKSIFLYDTASENAKVREFVEFYNHKYGELGVRHMYRYVAGEANPPPSVIMALLNFVPAVELQKLFAPDGLASAVAKQLRASQKVIEAIIEELEAS